jgi:hypothetical protein
MNDDIRPHFYRPHLLAHLFHDRGALFNNWSNA